MLYPISLSDVLTGLFVFGAALSLARNLPGLLEVLVLSKLRLAQGTAYAFTTMLNYALIGVGSLTALAIAGVQWEKLQWLAAGLSVGIGFGMQQIVSQLHLRASSHPVRAPGADRRHRHHRHHLGHGPARSGSAPPPSPTSTAGR